MSDKPKLFSVALSGRLTRHSPAYVVAKDPTEAYEIVRKWLDENGYGFTSERNLDCVTLMAEAYDYTDGSKLYIA